MLPAQRRCREVPWSTDLVIGNPCRWLVDQAAPRYDNPLPFNCFRFLEQILFIVTVHLRPEHNFKLIPTPYFAQLFSAAMIEATKTLYLASSGLDFSG